MSPYPDKSDIPASGCCSRAALWRLWAAASVAALVTGCGSATDGALRDFGRWHEDARARAQAQAGAMGWSEFYRQSFDRLTALPPSFQQDRQLETIVLLLSTARKYEAQEISATEFTARREEIEKQGETRLR